MLAPLHNRSRVIMFYGLLWIRGNDLSVRTVSRGAA
jgi:hypothetical protein